MCSFLSLEATVECWCHGPDIGLHGGVWADIYVNWHPHDHQDLEVAIKGYCIVVRWPVLSFTTINGFNVAVNECSYVSGVCHMGIG